MGARSVLPRFAIVFAIVLAVAVVLAIGSGSSSAVSAGVIDAGDAHTCAVTEGGAAFCWGLNEAGQLGVGTSDGPEICTNFGSDEYECSKTPLQVTNLTSGVTDISAGDSHSCAVQNGNVLCWGSDKFGQLGADSPATCEDVFGDIPCSTVPQPVSGLSDVKQVEAGSNHTCALTNGGAVYCWGSGLWGSLGNGSEDSEETPNPVTGLGSGVEQIALLATGGCALMDGGTVKCWGNNNEAQLGIGNDTGPEDCSSSRKCAKTPVDVPGLSGVMEIAGGDAHACVLFEAGTVSCWGYSGNGQVGNGDTNGPDDCLPGLGTACAMSPTPVAGVTGATDIDSSGSHTCVVVSGGDVMCWGRNSSGQLGTGDNDGPEDCDNGTCSPDAVEAQGLDFPVDAVSAGGGQTCVLTIHGGVECFGRAFEGQTGNDSADFYEFEPVYAIGFAGDVTPGPTIAPETMPWADWDCSGTTDAGDILPLLENATTTDDPPAGCRAIGNNIKVDGEKNLDWGDADCDGFTSYDDIYLLLYYWADLDIIVVNCFFPGDEVSVASR